MIGDPDAHLDGIRQHVRAILDFEPSSVRQELIDQARALAQAVRDLDAHLSARLSVPSSWCGGRDPEEAPEVEQVISPAGGITPDGEGSPEQDTGEDGAAASALPADEGEPAAEGAADDGEPAEIPEVAGSPESVPPPPV